MRYQHWRKTTIWRSRACSMKWTKWRKKSLHWSLSQSDLWSTMNHHSRMCYTATEKEVLSAFPMHLIAKRMRWDISRTQTIIVWGQVQSLTTHHRCPYLEGRVKVLILQGIVWYSVTLQMLVLRRGWEVIVTQLLNLKELDLGAMLFLSIVSINHHMDFQTSVVTFTCEVQFRTLLSTRIEVEFL